METSGPVLLFDGECGLCVRCVKILLALDRRLKFAPLQGETAQAFLRERGLATEDFDSAIFVADWARRREVSAASKTDALLASSIAVGGFWRLARVFKIVPRGWRDAFYDWVARRRRQIFGSVTSAEFSTSGRRDRFLP